MASTSAAEKFLTLQDGRTPAYDTSRNPGIKSVVVFFHGSMAGGFTSPLPSGTPFHTVVRRDTTAFFSHFHPDMATNSEHKLYIAGGSYGYVSTQIIYSSSLDEFPPLDRIVGTLVLTGLTMSIYFFLGLMAYNSPFKILPRIVA
ncbi:hypothetical protein DL96DRAFT_1826798 [Flagelloscypha sp. PMI_526]|nr:hypothetical protein DL96DRAFT_1826798 [Flagelloscypha sp. PMI_526]